MSTTPTIEEQIAGHASHDRRPLGTHFALTAIFGTGFVAVAA